MKNFKYKNFHYSLLILIIIIVLNVILFNNILFHFNCGSSIAITNTSHHHHCHLITNRNYTAFKFHDSSRSLHSRQLSQFNYVSMYEQHDPLGNSIVTFSNANLSIPTNAKLPTGSALLNLNFPSEFLSLKFSKASSANLNLTSKTNSSLTTTSELPSEFDWRKEDKVTPVRDQNVCNACYAFSVTSSIESALAIYYRIDISQVANLSTATVANLSRMEVHPNSYLVTNIENIPSGNLHLVDLNLSVQQLVDCTSSANSTNSTNKSTNDEYHNSACNYGYIEDTFRYVVDNGLVSEYQYPYVQNKSTCRQFPALVNRTFISSYRKIVLASNETIKKLIYHIGPVISLINDQGNEFLYYKDGIIRNEMNVLNLIKPNHAVLIVGWGTGLASEDSNEVIQYWIVKNSWSTKWGQNGYAKVQFGARSIGRYVYYPILFGASSGEQDLFRSIIVYVFLAVLIFAMMSFYCVARLCTSEFYRKRVWKRRKNFRILYFPKLKNKFKESTEGKTLTNRVDV